MTRIVKRAFLNSATGDFMQPGDEIDVGGTRAADLERLGLIEPMGAVKADDKAEQGAAKNKDAAQQRKNKAQDGAKADEKVDQAGGASGS